jgi:hypothetical protein
MKFGYSSREQICERIGERSGSVATASFAGIDPEASSKKPVLAVHHMSKSFEGGSCSARRLLADLCR